MVGLMAATSIIVFALTLHAHFAPQASAAPSEATMAMQASALATGQVGVASSPAQPVAATAWMGPSTFDMGATGANVHLVAGGDRTAFNMAASQIRPTVMGIHATLSTPSNAEPGVERIGSGVIVDAGGYLVTCQHVIAGATAIHISRFGRSSERIPARLVAVEDDLALVYAPAASGSVPAVLGDSEQVQVGDWVLAVGHPFGLGLTVTAGIVGRRHGALTIPGGRQYTGLLQTDAPINEGSSGGPLVNMAGQVIGINTAIYAPTGVFSGAGFAIPANRVRIFLDRIKAALGTTGTGRLLEQPMTMQPVQRNPLRMG
jgi:S1-C subfamily serine protease